MEMRERFCRECFADVVVAAQLKVDILPVARLLLVQSLFEEKLNHTAKVFLQRAIMLVGDHRGVDWLGEVVMQDLLPGSLVLPLQDVFELLERGSPVEVNFLRPLIMVGDCSVDSEFDVESTRVDMDFHFQLIEARVLVLHFVYFLWEIFLVKGLL